MKNKVIKKGIVFIIFGATGDLARKKLLPTIYNLIKNKKIANFYLIGIARRKISTNEWINLALDFIDDKSKDKENIVRLIKKNSEYISFNFQDDVEYSKLKEAIERIKKKKKINCKIFYLATLPDFFSIIVKNLLKFKIIEKNDKLAFEKPFSNDLKTAREISLATHKAFKEEQIYRVDHYLEKELVGNILMLRFANRIFEPLWNNRHIEEIQIILDEAIGVEGRGAYYDKYGAIKDMIQSHMLQLLSLLTIEMPKKLTQKYLAEEKVKILKKVIVKNAFIAQYKGYRKEKNVNKKSKTETFASLVTEVNNERWRGVKFFLRTGKKLGRKLSLIYVKFKRAKCIFAECPIYANYLTIRIWPNPSIILGINLKEPGEIEKIVPIKFDFCYNCVFGINTPKEYENIFENIIKGNRFGFVSEKEIEEQWKIVERIKRGKLYFYKPGNFPKEFYLFNKRNKIVWIK